MRISCLIILVCLFGCGKDKESDNQPPQITITSPANNSSYNGGDIVPVKANISDNKQIAEVHMHVINKTSGALVLDLHINPASPSYFLDQFIVASSGITNKIEVIARDNSGNETRASVDVLGN